LPEPPGLPPLREVIRRHGLAAKKALGQNFLLDLNLTGRIARAAGPLEGVAVVEIGPGPGGLTRALLAAGAAQVVAVEKDTRCLEALEELRRAYPERLVLVEGDALEADPVALAPAPRQIVANLPYNIATPLLLLWLRRMTEFRRLTLMFQKEVALRLVARPRSKDYGRLSVIAGFAAEPRLLFDIPPRAFVPAPKVTSTVVQLTPRTAPPGECRWEDLERITAAAFGQRRKMLRGSLKSLGRTVEDLLAAAGIPGEARAEELSVEEFCALAKELGAARDGQSPPAA
jgi:16S rRNA (adenine1518-N6/adenine1519-N6)-dimethyltransferase